MRARARRGAVVLLYHRVASPPSDPWELAVPPARFADHMRALARTFPVLPLADLAAAHAAGRLPRGAVAVTFDDAYGDVAREALPVLEALRVPATVFAVSGAVDAGREYWWDALDRLVGGAAALPPRLALGGTPLPVPREARGAPGAPGAAAARRALYYAAWDALRPLGAAERAAALDALAATLDAPAADPRDFPMTGAELRRWAASPVGTVGAHTVTHPRLAALPPAEQSREMDGSRAALAALLGRPVDLFAYPFGNPDAFTDETRRLARAAGFRAACANGGGAVRPGADPFALPRLYVRPWDAPTLVAEVRAALGA